MKFPDFSQKGLLTLAALLIAFSVFYSFVIRPVYTKYQLNNCLQEVDTNYISEKEQYCETIKPSNLNSCLHEAQSKIYCADPANIVSGSGSGFFGSISYCHQPVPDNSNGFWNNNIEYQQSAKDCEEQIAAKSCDFSKEEVDHSIGDVKAARDECFKLY